jgi:uncharacterized membrane protein YeiH
MDIFVLLDIVGIVSFALSGFLVGVRKDLDLLGIFIVTFLTALGGGIIRDAIVGRVPFSFSALYPQIFVIGTFLVALVLRIYKASSIERRRLFIISDSIGLAAFSVTGALIAIEASFNVLGVALLAFITAVGGGILRDMLINEVPFVLVSEFYGIIAILIGVSIFLLDLFSVNMAWGIAIVTTVGFTLRLIAYYRSWHLPKLS